MHLFKLVFTLLMVLSLGQSCNYGSSGAEGTLVMGTYCSIDLYENGTALLYKRLFARLSELELIFSANRDDSELAKINQNAGIEAVAISPELYIVLERALYFAEETGGVYDPTVGPLVKLWGIGTENRIPGDEEIAAALDLINYRDVELKLIDGTSATAFLKRKGMALDLGSIAKGFAADELCTILSEAGVPRALIDLGGNIYVWGKKKSGEPWNIGIQDPYGERGSYIGILKLQDSCSVVSSGVYERFFTDQGKNYHHIMELAENGKRGYPIENGILSTTIIAVSSMDADALSTACFLLGYEKGMALAASRGAEIVYVMEAKEKKEGKVIKGSPGAMAIFSMSPDMSSPAY